MRSSVISRIWYVAQAFTTSISKHACASLMQAPSPALAAFIKSSRLQQSSFISGDRVAFELQDNYVILQNCAREALDLSKQLLEEAHVQSESAMRMPRRGFDSAYTSASASEVLIEPDDKIGDNSPSTSATIGPSGSSGSAVASSRSHTLSQLELALMMTSMAEAVEEETKMMVRQQSDRIVCI